MWYLLAGLQGHIGSIKELDNGREQQVQVVVEVGTKLLDGIKQLQKRVHAAQSHTPQQLSGSFK